MNRSSFPRRSLNPDCCSGGLIASLYTRVYNNIYICSLSLSLSLYSHLYIYISYTERVVKEYGYRDLVVSLFFLHALATRCSPPVVAASIPTKVRPTDCSRRAPSSLECKRRAYPAADRPVLGGGEEETRPRPRRRLPPPGPRVLILRRLSRPFHPLSVTRAVGPS